MPEGFVSMYQPKLLSQTSGAARPMPKMEIVVPETDSDLLSYPPDCIEVRNTFIHVNSPAQTDEIFGRPTLSCPARSIGRMLMEEDASTSASQIQYALSDSISGSSDLWKVAGDCGLRPSWHAPTPEAQLPWEPTELPSLGSQGHYSGDCRPCAFLYAKGCLNGAMCNFCHLCDRGEKKRRQKARRAAFKIDQELEQ
mmetsp:Transcript_69404/g.162536  ORF Transcript_69404/g.162536 Transcript_69404/m.162536 type:complete len:197 (-) Transcript_69404:19-609(-)